MKRRTNNEPKTGALGDAHSKRHRPEVSTSVVNGVQGPAMPIVDWSASGGALLRWLLAPATSCSATDGSLDAASLEVATQAFFSSTLEQRPLYIGGRSSEYYSSIPSLANRVGEPFEEGWAELQSVLSNGIAWSTDSMRTAVASGRTSYTTDVNVVRFDPKLQKRVPLKTEGPIPLKEYDEALASKWSARFLRPQEHVPSLSHLLFLFDEAMGCSTGMNSYWTPGKSQGFAPHYDDVDVFLLQLEGAKRWRVYKPPTPADDLCRTSSPDYKPAELPAPALDLTLRAGELLYMPRGWVHQGVTTSDHSLHITLSAFQMHSYADFVKKMLAYKVDVAAAGDRDLRRALPVAWWNAMGSRFNAKVLGPYASTLSPAMTTLRSSIQRDVRRHCAAILRDVEQKDGLLDKSADLFGVDVLARRQPPPPFPSTTQPAADPASTSTSPTFVRLTAANAARLVVKTDEVEVHHCGGNSTVCLGPTTIAPCVTFDVEFTPALVTIVSGYPRWVSVDTLPFPELAEASAEELADVRNELVTALKETKVFEVSYNLARG